MYRDHFWPFDGGSKTISSTKLDALNKSVTTVITRALMNCSYNQTLQQRLQVAGDHNVVSGVQMAQATKLSTTCVQSAQNVANIQNDIAVALTQAAQANSVSLFNAFGNGVTSSQASANIQQIIESSITSETLTNIILLTNAEQGIDVSGSYNLVQNITLEQTSDIVMQNAQTVLNNTSLANLIRTSVDQSATATEASPLQAFVDLLGNLFNGFQYILYAIGAIVVIVVLYLGYTMIPGDDSESSDKESVSSTKTPMAVDKNATPSSKTPVPVDQVPA